MEIQICLKEMEKNNMTQKKFDYEEFNKRYDKFNKNNLLTPFWDEERQTLEYVYFYIGQKTIN